MGQVCYLCGKGKFKVGRRLKTRSKYNPTHAYFQKPNLQWLTLSNGQRVKICNKCRKKIIKQGLKV